MGCGVCPDALGRDSNRVEKALPLFRSSAASSISDCARKEGKAIANILYQERSGVADGLVRGTSEWRPELYLYAISDRRVKISFCKELTFDVTEHGLLHAVIKDLQVSWGADGTNLIWGAFNARNLINAYLIGCDEHPHAGIGNAMFCQINLLSR